MKRAWMHITPLITLVVVLSARAGGQQKPPPVAAVGPLRTVLGEKGYVAVPLLQEEEEAGCFIVECKSGAEKWRMSLDTGAARSALDMGLVKKLGLKHGDESEAVTIGGIRKSFEISLRGHLMGDFDTRTLASSLSLDAMDLTVLNTTRAQHKRQRIDGLLGCGALRLCGAVVDYPGRTLYLRTPLSGLWPDIEGRWVAVSGQEDGRKRQIDPAAAPRLEFKDRRFQLIDGTKHYRYGMHIKPEKDHYTLALFDPEEELAKELNYRAGGLLKVSQDGLSLCLCLDLLAANGKLPEDFKAPAGSGHQLLEFRRERSAARADEPPR
jgi:hypothetical protein